MPERTFTIPRVLFARLSAELYVRRFWWLLLPWPLLAIGMLAMTRDRNMIALAFVVGLWPTTIPLRAYLFTSKTARLFQQPTFVTTDQDHVYFHGQDGTGLKVSKDRISGRQRLHGYLALIVGHMNFAFIPESAAPEELLKG